jgi:hypothetical protein
MCVYMSVAVWQLLRSVRPWQLPRGLWVTDVYAWHVSRTRVRVGLVHRCQLQSQVTTQYVVTYRQSRRYATQLLVTTPVDCVWDVMAHAQKPDFVFQRNGRVHLNRPGASVQSTAGSRGVRISGSNAGYTMFWGSVKSTGCPLHSPVYPSLPFPCVTVCHHRLTGVYIQTTDNADVNRTSAAIASNTECRLRTSAFTSRKSPHTTIKSQPRLYIMCNNLWFKNNYYIHIFLKRNIT